MKAETDLVKVLIEDRVGDLSFRTKSSKTIKKTDVWRHKFDICFS